MNQTEIQPVLEAYYRSEIAGCANAVVSDITPMIDGWESIIYAFTLQVDPGQAQCLILRLYPGVDAISKSQQEYHGMRVLHQAGYPVPAVHYLERERSPWDKPFVIMDFIEGETLWPVLTRSSEGERTRLIYHFCQHWVDLHKLNWELFVPEDERELIRSSPYIFIDRWLDEVETYLDAFPDLQVMMPVLDWLRERRDQVPCGEPVPVHLDFHPGNIILGPDDSMTVIDWTQIQVSDPRFDLTWTLLLLGIYEGEALRKLALKTYQQLSRRSLNGLAFFTVASCLKRLGSVVISLSSGADQMGMRPDAVDMMRQDIPRLKLVYQLMQTHTGLHIPELEQLLTEAR